MELTKPTELTANGTDLCILMEHKYIFLHFFLINTHNFSHNSTNGMYFQPIFPKSKCKSAVSRVNLVSQTHFLQRLIYIESQWGHSLHYFRAPFKGWTALTSRVTESHLSTQRHATHWASLSHCVTSGVTSPRPADDPLAPSSSPRLWPCIWPLRGQSTQAITGILWVTSCSLSLFNSYRAVKQFKTGFKICNEINNLLLKANGNSAIVCYDNGCTS